LEGDAEGIVSCILNGQGKDGHSKARSVMLKSGKVFLDEFRASHIMREGNSTADFMAGHGSKGLLVQYFKDHMHDKLHSIVMKERLEISRIRPAW